MNWGRVLPNITLEEPEEDTLCDLFVYGDVFSDFHVTAWYHRVFDAADWSGG